MTRVNALADVGFHSRTVHGGAHTYGGFSVFQQFGFLDEEKLIERVSFHFPTIFSWTKVGNHPRFLDTQNIANQQKRIQFGGDFRSTFSAPPFGTSEAVIFRTFLRPARKQKLPISFGNQKFTAVCFSSKWCHQELRDIGKQRIFENMLIIRLVIPVKAKL